MEQLVYVYLQNRPISLFTASISDLKHLRQRKGGTGNWGGGHCEGGVHIVASLDLPVQQTNFYSIKSDKRGRHCEGGSTQCNVASFYLLSEQIGGTDTKRISSEQTLGAYFLFASTEWTFHSGRNEMVHFIPAGMEQFIPAGMKWVIPFRPE